MLIWCEKSGCQRSSIRQLPCNHQPHLRIRKTLKRHRVEFREEQRKCAAANPLLADAALQRTIPLLQRRPFITLPWPKPEDEVASALSSGCQEIPNKLSHCLPNLYTTHVASTWTPHSTTGWLGTCQQLLVRVRFPFTQPFPVTLKFRPDGVALVMPDDICCNSWACLCR